MNPGVQVARLCDLVLLFDGMEATCTLIPRRPGAARVPVTLTYDEMEKHLLPLVTAEDVPSEPPPFPGEVT